MLMNQSSRDHTLLDVRPSPGPGRGAVSRQSSRDKRRKRSLPGSTVRKEGSAISSTPEHPKHWPADDFVPTEELARQQGVRPIKSVEDLAAAEDPFESDEEYEAFLADLHASRRAGLA